MAANINRVVLVGNLTRDPEMKHLPSGTALCSLRIAVNTMIAITATPKTPATDHFVLLLMDEPLMLSGGGAQPRLRAPRKTGDSRRWH